MDHLQSALFTLRAKSFVHVLLPKGFTQGAIGEANATLPTGFLLFLSTQLAAIEVEIFIVKFAGQQGGVGVDKMPAQIRFPMLQRLFFNHCLHLLDKLRHGHIEFLEVRGFYGCDVFIPIKARAQFGQFRCGLLVVNIAGLAPFHTRLGGARQVGFNFEDRLRFFGGVFRLIAQQLEHVLHMLLVLFALFLRSRIIFEVIIAVRKSNSSLVGGGDHFAGILKIRIGAEIEEHIHADIVQVRNFGGQLRFFFQVGNAVEFCLNWGQALFINGFDVQA